MPSDTVAGAVVVIAGGASNLGLTIARRFARSGASVLIADGDAAVGAHAAASAREDGLSVSFETLDVRQPAQSRALVDRVVREHGKIDIWVNSAGISWSGPAETLVTDDWQNTFDVILSGAFFCSQAAGRQMLAQGHGVIVNMASVLGYKAVEYCVASCTAMAGVLMLTQALGVEWGKRGVRVIGVAPNTVPMDRRPADSMPANAEVHIRRTPLHRLGTADEVADAVLFLASRDAEYVTAETLRVDGGWVPYQLF